ncbi:hypothetical protein FDO65_05240 [Nakamurella flava]|uniref:Uncharacterized protein n=1 Tax=Nakamurella flava TaxID=2576308 RepID=A0A4U6QLM2_9ACTN|nr:DUF6191 domain-containing protein [Nakamurella flava]TKV61052.1 hypothetical protein FDO65_05240 [Nakamurella flava]
MGELGALFNPGMRHEQEERRAKALIREEEGDSREVDPRIDLESGVAVITTGDADDDEDSGHAAAADMSPVHRSIHASTTASDADPAADDDEPVATPPRPRPRGKRSLTSDTR